MKKSLNEYIREFGSYLQEKGKSEHTVERYTLIVFRMLKKIERTPENLTYEDITKYITWARDNLGFSNKVTTFSAIRKYLKYLKFKHKSKIYDEYLMEIETTDEDMFHIQEKRKKTDKDTLTLTEIQKLLKATKNNLRDYAIMLLFFHSWQRVGSIVNLNISDIDFDGSLNEQNGEFYHKIHIERAKREQSYDIWVESDVIKAIKEYLKVREEPISPEGITTYSGRKINGYIIGNYRQKLYHKDALFLNGNGGRLQERAINNIMQKYAVDIGLKKRIYTHLWRSTGISIADSNNVSLGQIMQRSGHTNLQSVRPYLNPKKDETNMNISTALRFDNRTNNQQPQQPQHQQPQQKSQVDLKEQLTQKFIKGEITETAYLLALKNLEKTTIETYKVGYQ